MKLAITDAHGGLIVESARRYVARSRHCIQELKATFENHETILQGHEATLQGHEATLQGHEAALRGQEATLQEREALLAARTYGVLVGTVKDGRLTPGGASPHYEIWVQGAGDYRVAVNVRSVDTSEVLVHYEPNYALPTKRDLAALAAGPHGFRALSTGPAGSGLDYLRDGLFPIGDMHPIPPDGAGVTLQNLLDAQIERAKADAGAIAIAFGEAFTDPGADQTFGFTPENGVHDIHMMQGNSGSFAADNRVNGDGALFIRFSGGATVALFIRFATQSTVTNESGAPAA